MPRMIVFDTETTGLSPRDGDRVLEIAALELRNELPTGKEYRILLNPQRDVPAEATRVHGFSTQDVQDCPLFGDVADEFLAFIQDSPLIAHNAPFDFGFINAELNLVGKPPLENEMIDTIVLARKMFPGMPASLDSLCNRFDIDKSERERQGHNALLDCKLLAEVYLELKGGRQRGLDLVVERGFRKKLNISHEMLTALENRTRGASVVVTEDDLARHEAFIGAIKNALWNA